MEELIAVVAGKMSPWIKKYSIMIAVLIFFVVNNQHEHGNSAT